MLKRTIHWEEARAYNNNYYVPVTLTLDEGIDGLFNGKTKVYPYQVLLMISEKEYSREYTMLTFLNADRDQPKYSG